MVKINLLRSRIPEYRNEYRNKIFLLKFELNYARMMERVKRVEEEVSSVLKRNSFREATITARNVEKKIPYETTKSFSERVGELKEGTEEWEKKRAKLLEEITERKFVVDSQGRVKGKKETITKTTETAEAVRATEKTVEGATDVAATATSIFASQKVQKMLGTIATKAKNFVKPIGEILKTTLGKIPISPTWAIPVAVFGALYIGRWVFRRISNAIEGHYAVDNIPQRNRGYFDMEQNRGYMTEEMRRRYTPFGSGKDALALQGQALEINQYMKNDAVVDGLNPIVANTMLNYYGSDVNVNLNATARLSNSLISTDYSKGHLGTYAFNAKMYMNRLGGVA